MRPSIVPAGPRRPFALQASGVTKLYGSTVALWAVDLALGGGEALVVRGPNASGKSTLLRILAGLTAPTRGSVRWLGEPDAPPPRIGFVAHQTHLWDAMTVWENVELHARLGRGDRARAEGAIGRLGLAAVVDASVRSLSSGLRRRAAIARVIAVDPDVLVLDEPFASLDAESAGLVAAELNRLREAGRLLIVASHEAERTSSVATRTVWLAEGQLQEPPAPARAWGALP